MGTILVAHYPHMLPFLKLGAILVAYYLQMLPCVKNGDITGCSTFSANATMCEKRDITGSAISANATSNHSAQVCETMLLTKSKVFII